MAAAKVWEGQFMASDIDEIATETASANINSNELQGRIQVVTCAGFDHSAINDAAPFDLVFANILKAPLLGLAPDMGSYIQDGGYAILSGILNHQADEVIAAYQAVGLNLVQHKKLGEWSTLTLRKA